MAIYQPATSHADTTEKHEITDADIIFLRALQSELNTQDNCGNAEPRFWVIAGKKCVPTGEDYADEIHLIDFNGEFIADNLTDGIEHAKTLFSEFENTPAKSLELKIKIQTDAWCECEVTETRHSDKTSYEYDITYVADILSIINDHLHLDYKAVYVKYEDHVYQDTLFLTHADAQDHLRKNAHNYDKQAHAYAMTATGSPRVEQLWRLLRTVDFDKIKEVT